MVRLCNIVLGSFGLVVKLKFLKVVWVLNLVWCNCCVRVVDLWWVILFLCNVCRNFRCFRLLLWVWVRWVLRVLSMLDSFRVCSVLCSVGL